MSRLGNATYLDHLRSESARFRDVLSRCDPEATVPSCPEWNVTDLLWHLGGEVQHFWHHVIAHRPLAPKDYEEPERPRSFAEVLAFFDEWHGRFVDVLAAADPDEPAWSWAAADSSQYVGWTYRRQAHEALIHRLDAQLAAGEVTALPADLAADGVDEALDVMYGELPSWGSFTPLPQFVEYRMPDVGESVWTQIGRFSGTDPEGEVHADEPDQHVVGAPEGPADLVVSGSANDLDGWLWHRSTSGVEISGDLEVREHVLKVLQQPID